MLKLSDSSVISHQLFQSLRDFMCLFEGVTKIDGASNMLINAETARFIAINRTIHEQLCQQHQLDYRQSLVVVQSYNWSRH